MSTVVCQVPNDEQVSQLLTDLLGREVQATWTPGNHEMPRHGMVASYCTDDGRTVALAVSDAGFACRTGAALVLVPPGGANESADAGEVPDHLEENFHEVVNIMASLLNADGGAHVRLGQVHAIGDPLDEEAAQILATPTKRRVFHTTVEGYGRGVVTFLFV
jgi:hypothetical protein